MTDKKLYYWPIWSSFANIQLIKELSLPPSYLMQQEYDSHSFSLLKENYNQEGNSNYNNENQIKPFHCKKCNKSFKRKHDLDRHTRIHTGERPFLCPCCQKGYTRSDTRRRHFLSEKACSQHPLVIQLQSHQKNLKNKKVF